MVTERRIPCEHRWDPAEVDWPLPHGASFSDIDAVAEIGGQFLFIEHKPAAFAWDHRSEGQRLMLLRLSRLPGCTVWWIRDRPDGYELGIFGQPLIRVTAGELSERIRQWGEQADQS